MDNKRLAQLSKDALKKALPKYSGFHVGAALLTADDKVYTGANIETSSYSLTICAERTAVFNAVLEGERKFKAIAIASDAEGFCPPCGACRQVLNDLCGDILVIMSDRNGNLKEMRLSELLPFSFGDKDLEK